MPLSPLSFRAVLVSACLAAMIVFGLGHSSVSAAQAAPAALMTAEELGKLRHAAMVPENKPATLDADVVRLFRLAPANQAVSVKTLTVKEAGETFKIIFVLATEDVMVWVMHSTNGDVFLTNSSRTLRAVLFMDATGTYLVKEDSQTWKEAANRYPAALKKWAELSHTLKEPR